MSRKVVHVVGTGTIGEPLIGLLCDFKEDLGIDEISFHKNTPLTTDRSKVRSLMSRGARLTTHEERIDGFNAILEGNIIARCNMIKINKRGGKIISDMNYQNSRLIPNWCVSSSIP